MNRIEQMIRQSFIELLRTQGFDRISVKMILEKDHISRTSFYKYYEDKYDLMNQVQQDLLDSFGVQFQQFLNAHPNMEVIHGIPADQEMYCSIFDFVNEHYDLLACLFGPNGDGLFFDRVMEYIKQLKPLMMEFVDHADRFNDLQWDNINSFLAYGYLGVITKWLNQGEERMPAEEMATMLSDIVHSYFTDSTQ